MNRFLNTIYKGDSLTENGAVSNSTSGSAVVDYFSKAGTYRNRALTEVFADVSAMWNKSKEECLKVIFYNRMISRKIKGFNTSSKVQSGQGNRDEFRKAIIWMARYQPAFLYPNLWMIPMIGTWKDLWHADLIGELNRNYVFGLILRGIYCDYNRELIAKYLPRIRSKSNVHNERHRTLNGFALALCKYLKWTPVQYRKFKSSGKAHLFQQKISLGKYDGIDFKSIPGKALFQMVNVTNDNGTTFIERHGMESRYLAWIKTQPIAKFTGYVYELMKIVNERMSAAQKYTVDKQFEGVLQMAKEDQSIKENVWCALDTSGSMKAKVANTSAFDICLSLGIYFSSLNEGAFKDHVIMFSQTSKLKKLSGTFSDRALQLLKDEVAWGSTNFQSVIDEIVRIRKSNPEIALDEYPSTLIVVSDMQFNPSGSSQTNYQRAMKKLKDVGLEEIKIVWWWVTGRAKDFPSTIKDKGTMLLGGFDGSIMSYLLKDKKDNVQQSFIPKGPQEIMEEALNQEIFDLIKIN